MQSDNGKKYINVSLQDSRRLFGDTVERNVPPVILASWPCLSVVAANQTGLDIRPCLFWFLVIILFAGQGRSKIPAPGLYLFFVSKMGLYLGTEPTEDTLRIEHLKVGCDIGKFVCEFEATLVYILSSRPVRGTSFQMKKKQVSKLSYRILLLYFIFPIKSPLT